MEVIIVESPGYMRHRDVLNSCILETDCAARKVADEAGGNILDFPEIVDTGGRRGHPEGDQNAGSHEILPAHPRHRCHNLARQRVAHVAVLEATAKSSWPGLEITQPLQDVFTLHRGELREERDT